jgi:hypothetical protein
MLEAGIVGSEVNFTCSSPTPLFQSLGLPETY